MSIPGERRKAVERVSTQLKRLLDPDSTHHSAKSEERGSDSVAVTKANGDCNNSRRATVAASSLPFPICSRYPRDFRRASHISSDMQTTLVIQNNDTPLAVLVRYEQYMAIQEQFKSLKETIQILTDEKEKAAVFDGLRDVAEGRVRPFGAVKATASKPKEKK
jgi:hypothetical protein